MESGAAAQGTSSLRIGWSVQSRPFWDWHDRNSEAALADDSRGLHRSTPLALTNAT
jgi:hypothetical protein